MSFLNQERYFDPTAGIAISNVARDERRKRYRPLVYISSRYAGDTENNIAAAKRYCRFAISRHCIPLAVHLLFPQFMDDDNPGERSLAMFFGNILMDKCDEVWIFGTELSDGMKAEYKRASRKGFPIRLFTLDCREVTSIGK